MARRELTGAKLGDARLSVRLEQLVESLAQRPSESLPHALGNAAALEGAYRFLGNEKVTSEAILAPHVEQTKERCAVAGRVMAVFDTTELRIQGHGGRDERDDGHVHRGDRSCCR